MGLGHVSVCETDTGCQTDMPHSMRAEAAKVAPMPIALLRSRLPRMAASIKVHMAVMVVNREPTKKMWCHGQLFSSKWFWKFFKSLLVVSSWFFELTSFAVTRVTMESKHSIKVLTTTFWCRCLASLASLATAAAWASWSWVEVAFLEFLHYIAFLIHRPTSIYASTQIDRGLKLALLCSPRKAICQLIRPNCPNSMVSNCD